MRGVRGFAALPIAVFVTVVLACGGDDSSNGNGSNSGTQPAACAAPCMPGALCYQPAPGSNCNGDWYCWSDSKWHCAPPDSGGPGGDDATVSLEAGGDDGPAVGDAEAGAPD